MPATTDFTKMLPGFDFLQGLMKNAGADLPGMSQWIAPTLDPDELDKRIGELRTVQFWLEQNARMIATTVQALEVQRMTLSTLKTMNVQVADLAKAFKLNDPVPPAPAAQPAPAPEPAKSASRASRPSGSASSASSAGHSAAASSPAQAAAGAAPGVVDPMQWWGALTQQFTQLAAQAMKDGSAEAAGQLAGAMVKSSAEAVGQAMQQAGLPTAGGAAAPGKGARKAAGAPAPSAASANASPARPARKAARAPTRRSAKRSA